MLEGYTDLRGELVALLGEPVTEQDVEVAVQAIVTNDRTTATPALAELNILAQSDEGKRKLKSMLGNWAGHERAHANKPGEEQAHAAIKHLVEGVNG